MSVEKDDYTPKEIGFELKINDRMSLWFNLVDGSGLDDEIKGLLKDRLTMLKEYKKHHWDIGDACYATVVNIRNATRGKGQEADALFENIRDDIWDFFEEI